MAKEAELTISDLAERSGMTVRTLRDYNERGLLPPPKMKGRTGFYGPEHLDRIRIVERLVERGITLNGVRGLLEAWDRGQDLADVLGVATAATPPPPQDATPDGLIAAADLADRFAAAPDGLARSVTAGLYEPVDQGTYRVAEPALLEVFEQLLDAGVSTDRALDEVEQLRLDCDHIARQFTDIFVRTAVRQFQRSNRAETDAEVLAAQLDSVRAQPAAITATVVGRFVERYVGRVVDREFPGMFAPGT
ncbi:MerR family transcriptional regulator [Nocardia suismassiliense]|uniref:MerR family transcriptional regulator n=1 Tax=Nocardia suismassiliense TaxID=2077092 RepID=A0ABW6R3M2_9NOCA